MLGQSACQKRTFTYETIPGVKYLAMENKIFVSEMNSFSKAVILQCGNWGFLIPWSAKD